MNKTAILREHLLENGRLSNVEVLNGNPCRTNRLGAFIHSFRNQGLNIDTEIVKTDKGEYIDCVYVLNRG